MTIHPHLSKDSLANAYNSYIIIKSALFHPQKCPNLDNKLYGGHI